MVAVDSTGGYDACGNVTKLGAVSMGYDAESNMTNTADSGTGQSIPWIYDAEGQRAQKWVSGGATVVYVHDAFGQLAAEYSSTGVTPACTTCYLTYDMLGSPRLITDQNQSVVTRHDYLPFGEESVPISITLPRPGDRNHYWDHPIMRIHPGDAVLELIDYFDFDVLGFLDFKYLRVRILSFPSAGELVGREALIPCEYADVVVGLDGCPEPATSDS